MIRCRCSLIQDAPNGIFTGCLMWPHLFPLYASQIFKTNKTANFQSYSPFAIEILRYGTRLRHDRGRYISDSRVIQGYLYFLYIYCITLLEIIPEIVFGKRHDPGEITYLTHRTEGNILLKTKIKDRQKVFLNEHENLTIKPLIFKTILPSQLK